MTSSSSASAIQRAVNNLEMNPYEADPSKIPPNDPYAGDPLYGRYLPQPSDFKPDPEHFNSTTPESLDYWASVLQLCNSNTLLFDNPWGGRDVFAVGSLIVKSGHRKEGMTRDYAYADANEVDAIALARKSLREIDVRVPEIYFSGMINGKSVLVQERIPGVCLGVAWPYLSLDQKTSFKQQARQVLRQIHRLQPPPKSKRSYVVTDPDPLRNRGIQELERDIIWSANNDDSDLGLMHNDCQPSNIIVDKDKIIALIDWEMAGYIGWRTAHRVHLEIRMPKREYFANAQLSEDKLTDILFWNDLYSDDVD